MPVSRKDRNKTLARKVVRRPKPTEKQKEFVRELSTTLDPVSSYQKVFKSTRDHARKHAPDIMKAAGIKTLMNTPKVGLSDEFLLERLKRALLAKRLVWSKSKEDWLEEVDWSTQVKALEIAFRLKGHLNSKAPELDLEQAKEINVTFNLVKARSIDEIAKLTDQTSIAKARPPITEKAEEGELIEENDKNISGD